MSGFILMAPLLALVVGGLIAMMVDGFVKKGAELATLTTLIFTVAGGFSLALWMTGADAEAAHPAIATYLATDKMALFFDLVICAGGALSTLLAGGYLREHGMERGEFYILIIFSALGAMVLARSVDLLSLFLGLETMSLGVYAMAGYRRTSARAVEGAVKYFLLGSFAAAILLFGSALLYGATNHTSFAGIGAAITEGSAEPRLLLVGFAMLLIGLIFKVSAVPFHQWTPDVYEGTVTPGTTFMSVVVKAAAFAVLVRVLMVSFGGEEMTSGSSGWPAFLAAIAVVTMIGGNLAAISQKSVKRMLAYSSIAHAGYILVGVCAAAYTEEAISAVFYYLLAYTASNVLAFGSLIVVGSKGKEAVSYEDLAGVGRRHPMVAIPFIVGTLSLLGLPPTAGFFAKYYVFNAAVQAGGGMVWLAVIGVLASAVGAFYYLKVIVYMFMKEPQKGAPIAVPMRSAYVVVALIISGYFVMKMGITPSVYLEMAVEAARQLVAA